MSLIDGAASEVLGVLLVAAEGCSETSGEVWLREATNEEQALFVSHCRSLLQKTKGQRCADSFEFGDLAVDGSGRPYWLMAVLDHPATPTMAREKAAKYTRVLRVHSD